MHYAICNSDNENSPYQVLSFTSLASMKDCTFIDEHSMVYNDKDSKQLTENWQKDELEGVWSSIILNDKKAHLKFADDFNLYNPYNRVSRGFQNKEIAAQKLHELVLFCVKPWKKEKQMNATAEVTAVSVDQFNNKNQKAEKEARPRFEKATKIVALMELPPIRSGTNRYRNMEIVMGCATVAEAMEKLRALETAPGGGVDIKIAVKAGAIKLEE
jgi:hypothetical protein|tara:strand:- start:571 stop:1215 length:645 start_codon:yes stop_codon:yes gene_type:complete